MCKITIFALSFAGFATTVKRRSSPLESYGESLKETPRRLEIIGTAVIGEQVGLASEITSSYSSTRHLSRPPPS